MRRKLSIYGAVTLTVLVLDVITKRWALDTLAGNPSQLFGGAVPLTLAFNRGAAFGISIGSDPRLFFVPVTLLALGLLGMLLVKAESRDYLRILPVSMVMAGAVGNLIDRIRWDRGVVDFIGPIDLGFMDWPIFNVADMSISVGAALLALSFWVEERNMREADNLETREPAREDDPVQDAAT